MESAVKNNCMVICVTSGGKIAMNAKHHECGLILIPGGNPPRACLAYSLTQILYILHHYNLISNNFKTEMSDAIELLEKEERTIHLEAKLMSDFFYNRIPVIYTIDGYNGVATRFRQQINENAKMLCWHNILPEMNHNELVGWTENHDELAVIFLRNKDDYSRTQARYAISKEVIEKYCPHTHELWSKGQSRLARTLYLIHITDWISVFLAEKKNVDVMEVKVIDHLKGELSKLDA
jgi:glucose/mannose-6-phosphate isomerase